jgi:hypothetical protein
MSPGSNAGVVNIGLSAMIVNGGDVSAVLPKPRSMRIALSDILSSRRLSTVGSKVVCELQLRGFGALGDEGSVEAAVTERAEEFDG